MPETVGEKWELGVTVRDIGRRTFIRTTGVGAMSLGMALAGCSGPGPGPIERRKNVLFISVDDLNDWVGFLAGHPQVVTPGLDALAARSTVFNRAYCAAPVCSPSRASTLSGLTPQNTGVFFLSQTFASVNGDKPLVDDMFRAAGYRTARVGKVDHIGELYLAPLPGRPPFNNLDCPEPGSDGAFDWLAVDEPDDQMPDYRYAQGGIDFLDGHTGDEPFFLSVGFVLPHVGWWAPKRFYDLYPLDTLVIPTPPVDDLDDLGVAGRAIAHQQEHHACITGQGLWAEAVQAYLASISWIDTQVARLVQHLDQSRHAEDTLVVLWSDHGFHLGEKFHWQKLALWERSTRVPVLIREPGQARERRVDNIVSLCDLAPTVLDYCGVDPAYAMDGRSLVPLLHGTDVAWEDRVLTTKDQHNHAIRTPEWRYIRYWNGERELYNEVNDPDEHYNLAGLAEYEALMAELDAYMPPPRA